MDATKECDPDVVINLSENRTNPLPVVVHKSPSVQPVTLQPAAALRPPRKRTRNNRTKKPKNTSGTKKGKQTSEIWLHFTKLKIEGVEDERAMCNYCGEDYASNSKHCGTSTLWTHLTKCPKYPYRVIDKKQKTLVWELKPKIDEGSGPIASLKAVHFTVEEGRKLLARMVIIDELPFKFVEGQGFRAYSEYLQPRMVIPSRVTVARDCTQLYNEEKVKLKRVIQGERVNLTTDGWTSIQNLNYMCLTAHWVDSDWNLQKRILNFCQIPNHKGETVGKTIEACLLHWGIDKILTITVDNASSNDVALRYVKRRTRDWKWTVCDNNFIHVRCCAHIVNLIVQEGLSEQNDAITKIRNAVRFVRSSPSRLEMFKRCVEKEKIECKKSLCLDVETRWNSTYLMLDTAEKFEAAFERLAEDDTRFLQYFSTGSEETEVAAESFGVDRLGKRKTRVLGPPNRADWNICRALVKFLKVFYNITLKLSGTLNVTSNYFFHEIMELQNILVQLSMHDDSVLSDMAKKMKVKFDKYWDNLDNVNLLLYVAVVLDPRYKLKYVKFCFEQIYDQTRSETLIAKVEDCLNLLFINYDQHDATTVCSSVDTFNASSSGVGGWVNVNDIGSEGLKERFARQLMNEQNLESKTELARYLLECCEDSMRSFDILCWWKMNATKYPTLAMIARDVLAIQVSTVASESTFSTSGRILDPF